MLGMGGYAWHGWGESMAGQRLSSILLRRARYICRRNMNVEDGVMARIVWMKGDSLALILFQAN